MRCNRCDRPVADDMAFCPYCGEKVTSSGTTFDPEPGPENADRLKPKSGKHPPEEELWSDSYSPKALFGPFIALDLLVVAALVAVVLYANTAIGWLSLGGLVLLVYGGLAVTLIYHRLAVRYRVTTYRLFHEHGILRRVTDRIEMIDIDDVTVNQGLIERMLGVGTIVIASSDRTHPQLRMPGIDDVRKVADLIDNTRRSERQRRGLHIESI